jgi:hypothetical protein
MAASNEPTGSELLAILTRWVEKELRAELDRHAKAGHPMIRKQALAMANNHLREKLMQMAEQEEKNGNDQSADLLRTLALDLPGLMLELGLT